MSKGYICFCIQYHIQSFHIHSLNSTRIWTDVTYFGCFLRFSSREITTKLFVCYNMRSFDFVTIFTENDINVIFVYTVLMMTMYITHIAWLGPAETSFSWSVLPAVSHHLDCCCLNLTGWELASEIIYKNWILINQITRNFSWFKCLVWMLENLDNI